MSNFPSKPTNASKPRVNLWLDYETYYAKDYTLSGMTTTNYVLDERFKAHGVALAVGAGAPVWITHDKIPEAFAKIPWHRTTTLSWNSPFDALITNKIYGYRSSRDIDLLGVSRAVIGYAIKSHGLDAVAKHLGLAGKTLSKALEAVKGTRDLSPQQEANLVPYALDDVIQMRKVASIILRDFPVAEYRRLDWTIKMYLDYKLAIDTDPLDDLVAQEVLETEALVAKTPYNKTQIGSNKQLAVLLESLGVTVPIKVSKTTGKETYDMGKGTKAFTDLLLHSDSRVRDLIGARLAVKSTINLTRSNTFKGVAEATGGGMPVPLLYSGAKQTHRLSGSDKLNVQNLGRDSPLREAVVAPDGHVLVGYDLSNIELRTNAQMWSETATLELIREGRDVYAWFAESIYGYAVDKKNFPDERNIGKTSILSLGYQAAAQSLQSMFWSQQGMYMDLDFCEKVVALYRKLHPHIRAGWKALEGLLARSVAGDTNIEMPSTCCAPVEWDNSSAGFILPSGLKVKYPHLRRETAPNKWGGFGYEYLSYGGFVNGPVDNIYGGRMNNNLNQAIAREVLMDMHDRIEDETAESAAMQIHDEFLWVIRETEAEAFSQIVNRHMSTAPAWWPELPVACEGGIAQRYSDAK